MKFTKFVSLLFVSLVASAPTKEKSIVTYPLPSIYSTSELYKLQADGNNVDVINFYEGYDYAHFSAHDGPVEYVLTAKEDITDVRISPEKLNIKYEKEGKTLKFGLDKPEYLIIKINDQKELVFMADPFETDVPDPEKSINVKDYGADGSDKDHVTQGIQKALDAAGKKPGSTVYVPEGVYYTGNLVIPSDTELYMAPGSVVKFTGNASDYERKYTKDALDSSNGTWFVSTAVGSENIKMRGRGTIDGNGYYSQKQSKFICNMVVPVGVKNFKYDGILVFDSPFWAVQPTQSKDVTFENFKIINRMDLSQDDGIDVVDSSDVVIRRSISVSADDPFSTKTWEEDTDIAEQFPYPPMSLNNVLFDDCLSWTKCYGFKMGQGVFSDQTSVKFTNGVVYDAGVGIGIDHKYGTKVAQDILFENISVEHVHGNSGGQKGWLSLLIEMDRDLGVGNLTDITISNIRVGNIDSGSGTIRGYDSPDSLIDGVTLENIFILDNTTAASTLEEMNLLDVALAENIKIKP